MEFPQKEAKSRAKNQKQKTTHKKNRENMEIDAFRDITFLMFPWEFQACFNWGSWLWSFLSVVGRRKVILKRNKQKNGIWKCVIDRKYFVGLRRKEKMNSGTKEHIILPLIVH